MMESKKSKSQRRAARIAEKERRDDSGLRRGRDGNYPDRAGWSVDANDEFVWINADGSEVR